MTSENLLTLSQAARTLPRRPHVSTMWRWTRRGAKGIRLESWCIGGRRYTSTEALARFIAATTAAADGQPVPTRTPKERERAILKAEAELTKAGI